MSSEHGLIWLINFYSENEEKQNFLLKKITFILCLIQLVFYFSLFLNKIQAIKRRFTSNFNNKENVRKFNKF